MRKSQLIFVITCNLLYYIKTVFHILLPWLSYGTIKNVHRCYFYIFTYCLNSLLTPVLFWCDLRGLTPGIYHSKKQHYEGNLWIHWCMYYMKTCLCVSISFSGCLPTPLLILRHLNNINYSLLNSLYSFKIAVTLRISTRTHLAQLNTVEPYQFTSPKDNFAYIFNWEGYGSNMYIPQKEF